MRLPWFTLPLLALAACGEVAGPVPLQRLWISHPPPALDPWTWQGVGADWRPGWTLRSGQVVEVPLEVPAERPSWLLCDVAATKGGPVLIEVRVQDQLVRSELREPGRPAGMGAYAEVRVDLGPWRGQRVDLVLALEAEGEPVQLTRPRMVAQEAYDLRRLEMVVLLVSASVLDELTTSLPDVLGPLASGALDVPSTDPSGRGPRLLEGLGAGHDQRDRELFVWSATPPVGPADGWWQGDPWTRIEAGGEKQERLLALAERPRPHPVTLVVETQADAATLTAALGHLRQRLGGRDARTLWVVTTVDAPGRAPVLVRLPERTAGVRLGLAGGASESATWEGLAGSLLWAMDRVAGREVGPAPGNSLLILRS